MSDCLSVGLSVRLSHVGIFRNCWIYRGVRKTMRYRRNLWW